MLTWWVNCFGRRRGPKGSILALLAAGLVGCESTVSPEGGAQSGVVQLPEQPVSVRQAVVPALAETLDEAGVFPSRAAEGANAITPGRARILAEQYAKEFLPYHASRLAEEHGAAIDFTSLVADQRVLLAASPVQDPGHAAPKPIRKAMGAYYLVTLRQNGAPAVRVAVSALSDDIAVRDGHLRAPPVYGNEFRSHGIPLDPSRETVTSPEAIAAYVTAQTGVLNVAEPRYIRRGVRWSPHVGMWRVTLERAVAVRVPGQARPIETTELFVSNDGALALPENDPAPEVLHFRDRAIATERLPGLSWSSFSEARLTGGGR